MRNVRNLQQRVEQLQATLEGSQEALQQLDVNTAVIYNNFDLVLGGIRSIHGFYEQVSCVSNFEKTFGTNVRTCRFVRHWKHSEASWITDM